MLQERNKPIKATRWDRGNRSRRSCVHQTNRQWLVQRRKILRHASRGNGLRILTLGPEGRVRGGCPSRETTQGTSHKKIRLRWHMTFRTPTPEATCFHRPHTRLTIGANNNAVLLPPQYQCDSWCPQVEPSSHCTSHTHPPCNPASLPQQCAHGPGVHCVPIHPLHKNVFTTQEPGVTRATDCPDLQNVSALNNASTLTGTSTRPEASPSPKDRLPSVTLEQNALPLRISNVDEATARS